MSALRLVAPAAALLVGLLATSPIVAQTTDSFAASDRTLVQQIRGSKVLLLMKGERGFWSRERHSILDAVFLDRLEKALLPGPG